MLERVLHLKRLRFDYLTVTFRKITVCPPMRSQSRIICFVLETIFVLTSLLLGSYLGGLDSRVRPHQALLYTCPVIGAIFIEAESFGLPRTG